MSSSVATSSFFQPAILAGADPQKRWLTTALAATGVALLLLGLGGYLASIHNMPGTIGLCVTSGLLSAFALLCVRQAKKQRARETEFLQAIEKKEGETIRKMAGNDSSLVHLKVYHNPVLHAVIHRGMQSPVIISLINSGADVSLRDKQGNTCLHLLASRLQIKSIQALVTAREIDLNAVDNNGNTALHLAVMTGCARYNYDSAVIEVIHLLKSFGADINKRNREGETALELVETTVQLGDPKEFQFQHMFIRHLLGAYPSEDLSSQLLTDTKRILKLPDTAEVQTTVKISRPSSESEEWEVKMTLQGKPSLLLQLNFTHGK